MIVLIGAVLSFALLVTATPYEARFDGRPAAHWASHLTSKDPGERRRAAFALNRIACCSGVGTRVSGHVRELAATLRDPDPLECDVVSRAAATALLAVKRE